MKTINELNKEHYSKFEDMQALVSAMVKNPKVWCWGARGWTNIEGKILRFRVSGHLFKGVVYIGVNGSDLFDIYLANVKGVIRQQISDIYLDDLITVIDEKVEKIADYKW